MKATIAEMETSLPHFLPYVAAALLAYAVYRRIRRTFGLQRLRPVRMGIRIAILLVVAAGMLPTALHSHSLLLGDLIGLCAGVGLGLLGAERTRFVRHEGGWHYLPHTYTGIAVTALFLGRLAYRLLAGDGAHTAQGIAPFSAVQSPVTAGILFVLIGYYVIYYSLLLYRSQHLKPEDIEPPSGDAPLTSQR